MTPRAVQLITYHHKYSDLQVSVHKSEWEALNEFINFLMMESNRTDSFNIVLLKKFKTHRYGSCKLGREWIQNFIEKNDPGIEYKIVPLKLPEGLVVAHEPRDN